jgi:acyl-CoA thioester hydrolase
MGAFRYPIRVRYADTDALGVVYNAVYLAWFEIGRTEWLRARGLPYSEVETRGLSLPVTEASIRFRAPARYDDLIEIETDLQLVRSRVVAFGYRLYRGECRLAEGRTVHAPLDASSGRAIRIPAWLATALGAPHEPENK